MRVSRIRWVTHSKSTILSVDVQPNGYRFITGGADAYVRIWNLMPVICFDQEMEGETEPDEEGSLVADMEASENPKGQNSESGAHKNHKDREDSKMQEDGDSESDDGLTPEERDRQEAIAKEYAKDIKLMESLFPDEGSKSKRLLATLEGHQAPINCVRWNNLGTIFASADDEGTINLWQYRGKTVLSAYQAQAFGLGNKKAAPAPSFEDAKAAFAKSDEKEKSEENDEFEDWAVLKRCRGHRGSKCAPKTPHLFLFQQFLTWPGALTTSTSRVAAQTRQFASGMLMNTVRVFVYLTPNQLV